jgi:hypothetical protein
MSKVITNRILNAHGLAFARFKSPDFTCDTLPCIVKNGKRVKGIYCGKTGPLTVTDAVDKKKLAILRDLVMDLQRVAKKVTGTKFIVAETSRSITYLELDNNNYPAYQYSAGLDESYRSHYIVPAYYTEKK